MDIPSLSIDPQQLLEAALAAGASHAEIYWSAAKSRPVTFEGNRLKQVEFLESEGVALRVWKSGRCGLAVACGTLDREATVQHLVEKALALCEFSHPGPVLLGDRSPSTWQLPPPDMSVETMVELGEEGIEKLQAVQKKLICNGELSFEVDAIGLMNSHGLNCQFVDFNLDGYLGIEWVRGEDFWEVDAGESISPRPGRQTPSLHVDLWVQAIQQRLLWGERFAEVTSGTYPVVLLPTAVELVLDSVTAALNGRQLFRQSSPWSDKQGDRVASPLLTLSQSPLMGPFGVPFDDEGEQTREVEFIREGIFRQGYCDRRYASQLNAKPTGNGFRHGLNHDPEPGLFNVVLPKPSLSFEQLLVRMGRGLVVERVMGNLGDISGEFSVSVELGYWVEGGEIVGRVKDVAIAGNAYKTLMAIGEFGSAPDTITPEGRDWAGAYCVPAILVEGISTISQAD